MECLGCTRLSLLLGRRIGASIGIGAQWLIEVPSSLKISNA